MSKPLIGIAADMAEAPKGGSERVFVPRSYVDAVAGAGGLPVILPPAAERTPELLSRLDGLLLVGGADCDPSAYGEEAHPSICLVDRRRQAADLELAAHARASSLPSLGICLGMQMMAVAAGGRLVQDIASELGTAIRHDSDVTDRVRHPVRVEPGSLVARAVGEGELEVNSTHHQAVRTPGEGLRITALAPDGIIEAIEDPTHPFYVGVQWHPEDQTRERAGGLFAALIEAASAARPRRG